MTDTKLLQQEAETLAQLYFEGETTLAQERRLGELLRDAGITGALANEARAVMSFAAMPVAAPESGRSGFSWRAVVSVAASVACVATLGLGVLTIGSRSDDCIAYVDGHRIDNDSKVVEMMHAELALAADVSNEVDEDIVSELSVFSEVLNDNNNEKL